MIVEFDKSKSEKPPELLQEDFARAVSFADFAKKHGVDVPQSGNRIMVNGKPRIHRSRQKTPIKVAVSLRLHPDTLDAFRKSGRGWQTRIDVALAEYVQEGRLGRKS